jgi:hypothetical protein
MEADMWRGFSKDDLIKDIRLIMCIQAMHTRAMGACDASIAHYIGTSAADSLPDVDQSDWVSRIIADTDLNSIDPTCGYFGEFLVERFEYLTDNSQVVFGDIDLNHAPRFLDSLPHAADNGLVPKCLSESGCVRILLEYIAASARIWCYFDSQMNWISVKSLAHLALTSQQTVRNALSQKKDEFRTKIFDGEVAVFIPSAIRWMAGRRHFKPGRERMSSRLTLAHLTRSPRLPDDHLAWLQSRAFWNCGLAPAISEKSGLPIETVDQILVGDTAVDDESIVKFADATGIDHEALLQAFASNFQSKS